MRFTINESTYNSNISCYHPHLLFYHLAQTSHSQSSAMIYITSTKTSRTPSTSISSFINSNTCHTICSFNLINQSNILCLISHVQANLRQRNLVLYSPTFNDELYKRFSRRRNDPLKKCR